MLLAYDVRSSWSPHWQWLADIDCHYVFYNTCSEFQCLLWFPCWESTFFPLPHSFLPCFCKWHNGIICSHIINHHDFTILIQKDRLTPVEGSESLVLDAVHKATAHPNGGHVQLHSFGIRRIHPSHLDILRHRSFIFGIYFL